LAIGDKVSIGGLTFTASAAILGSDLADLFSNLQDGKTPSSPVSGAFTGALKGFSSASKSGSTVAFTSTATGTNVTDLSATPLSTSIDLVQGKDTPQEIVRAINLSATVNATGIKASLANTGDATNPYRIVLSGNLGASNAFTLEAVDKNSPNGNLISFDPLLNQPADDAMVNVNGVNYKRTSNTLTDVIPGVTLNLKGLTGATPATLDLTRDDSALKTNINALVAAYNDAITMFGVVSDPKSTVETYGATLVGNSLVTSLKQQLRSMFSGESSAAKGAVSVKSLWQIGISVDQKGVMSLDNAKLDGALQNNYNDVMVSFTGGYNKVSTYVSMPNAGFANDAYLKINKLLSNTGPMTTQTDNANKQNTKYKDDLTKLQTRMDSMLARYTKQFASMNSMVGNVNSQKTSLKSSFDGMMATYTNK
jgi:flagellar hook-associated protein 2